MRVIYAKVRARSANEGSGMGGWSLVALVLACFLKEEDITPPGASLNNRAGDVHETQIG
jgi:hypothetical protein